jgi:hypothetical protein
MDEIRKLLTENAVLPLWPETGKLVLGLSRGGDVCGRRKGRHQDGLIWPAPQGAHRLAAAKARARRAGGMSDAICHQCGKPLPATARRLARFCSPAHRAAYHRSSTAAKMARVRFPVAHTRHKSAAGAYVATVPDERFPGMYRLKRTDGSLSDMVNLTRAKDALAKLDNRSRRIDRAVGTDAGAARSAQERTRTFNRRPHARNRTLLEVSGLNRNARHRHGRRVT